MHDGSLLEPRSFAHAQDQRGDPGDEAAEVAGLLLRAGVDHASSLWFQLIELATQRACDWSERSAAAGAPLSTRHAAALGLRSLALEILSAAPGQADGASEAAEACLGVCSQVEVQAAGLPPRRRRWGEGALPRPPKRPGLLEGRAGCC
ncbi:hypothetical protein LJR225_001484 [Phenylobacterium sp. LjRoot225]|uniref:hypothetical protein n=1 Tax=Phenylobacterium sp. LjRoot225 TaxID=3342285 RepID=UPI003ECEFF8C